MMTKKEWDDKVSEDTVKYNDTKNKLSKRCPDLNQSEIDYYAKEFFDIGFEEGQRFVWFMRSGFGETNDVSDNYTMTVSNGEGTIKQYKYENGKLVEEK